MLRVATTEISNEETGTEERGFKTSTQNSSTSYSDQVGTPKNFHELDVIAQLNANIEQLDRLQFRLSFLVSEIRSVIKK